MKTNKFLLGALALTIGMTAFISCGDDDDAPIASLPPIGGFNNANEVAAADLVAHWPLDGNGTERISNTTPSSSIGTTWEAGAKGQGAKLTNGYLAYPVISALGTTSQNMTVSLWAKVTNNGGPGSTNGRPTMLFNLDRQNEWAGNFNLISETGWYAATNDTLILKGLAVIKNTDGSANFQDVINSPKPSAADLADGHTGNPNKNGNKWAHYVATWEASTGRFMLYANGVKISNAKFEVRGGGNALPLNFFTPTKPIIGAFQTNVAGNPDAWQTPAQANIDEIRVWKKTLSASDIGSLYELEKAGR
jgi:hypothetical protein